ncbi:MAG TPA: hypothetical protein VKA01_04655 [Vicinamibacteria bacterium]|nr:hypothetical protein [Vicinamibacteria bacterium]
MSVADRIAAVLGPHLGAHSADAVARHMCAKHGIDEGIAEKKLGEFQEFMRRGLVAFVGSDRAAALAAECIQRVREPAAK